MLDTPREEISQDGVRMASLLLTIEALFEIDPHGVGEAVLVRTIQREASLDLDDDHILYVVRDCADHGHGAEEALNRLMTLDVAGHSSIGTMRPR